MNFSPLPGAFLRNIALIYYVTA